MKKNFKFYSLVWILLLALFNVVVFLVPALPGAEKYTDSFWIGYSFITVAFLGQFACSWFVFKEDSTKKAFYNISLFLVSYTGLITTFVVGLLCMIIPAIPGWLTAVLCSVILVINIFAVVKAKMAVDFVQKVDEKIEKATSFICDMREESESLLARAKDEETKAICKKVSDAFRYSDPMSNEGLKEIEAEIKNHFDLLKAVVREAKAEAVKAEAEEIIVLVAQRNNKCKRMK